MRQGLVGSGAVVAVGAFVAAVAWSYPLGTSTRMGPGFLPFILGLVLVATGIVIGIVDWRAQAPVSGLSLRPLFAVVAAIAAWVTIVPLFGLVPATVALVVLASLSQPRISWISVALTSIVLSAFGVLAFIEGLGLRLEAFRF